MINLRRTEKLSKTTREYSGNKQTHKLFIYKQKWQIRGGGPESNSRDHPQSWNCRGYTEYMTDGWSMDGQMDGCIVIKGSVISDS